MPQAAVVAGISAAGALGGGVLASRAQNKATKASSQANQRALDFEKQRYEQERAERQKAWEAYQAMREPYRRAAREVMRRWGYDFPDTPSQSTPPPDWQPGMDVPSRSSMSSDDPPPLSQPMDSGVASTGPRLTLGNLSRWSDVIGLG